MPGTLVRKAVGSTRHATRMSMDMSRTRCWGVHQQAHTKQSLQILANSLTLSPPQKLSECPDSPTGRAHPHLQEVPMRGGQEGGKDIQEEHGVCW